MTLLRLLLISTALVLSARADTLAPVYSYFAPCNMSFEARAGVPDCASLITFANDNYGDFGMNGLPIDLGYMMSSTTVTASNQSGEVIGLAPCGQCEAMGFYGKDGVLRLFYDGMNSANWPVGINSSGIVVGDGADGGFIVVSGQTEPFTFGGALADLKPYVRTLRGIDELNSVEVRIDSPADFGWGIISEGPLTSNPEPYSITLLGAALLLFTVRRRIPYCSGSRPSDH